MAVTGFRMVSARILDDGRSAKRAVEQPIGRSALGVISLAGSPSSADDDRRVLQARRGRYQACRCRERRISIQISWPSVSTPTGERMISFLSLSNGDLGPSELPQWTERSPCSDRVVVDGNDWRIRESREEEPQTWRQHGGTCREHDRRTHPHRRVDQILSARDVRSPCRVERVDPEPYYERTQRAGTAPNTKAFHLT